MTLNLFMQWLLLGDKYGETDISQDGYEYNGIFSSITYFISNSIDVGLSIINQYGQGDKIIAVFTVPKFCVKSQIPVDPGGGTNYYFKPLELNFKQDPVIKNLVSTPTTIDGYTPKNNKLRTYPYLYLGFNPQNGTKNIYRYEDFSNGTPSFKIISEINPNPTIQFIPQNYRGVSGDNVNDSSTMGGYPNVSYTTDVYNIWLAQNSEIINLQMEQEQYNYEISAIKGGINMTQGLVSAGTGNVSGVTDTVNSTLDLMSLDKNHEYYIKNQMAQVEKQKLLPNSATMGSSNSTLLGYDLMTNQIFARYNIKQEYAKRIDNYFSMFGYLTNDVKLPNLNNRSNWNYVKTIGANIIGNIPQMDLQMLKNMFDNGITLWHTTTNFLDYSQNNNQKGFKIYEKNKISESTKFKIY